MFRIFRLNFNEFLVFSYDPMGDAYVFAGLGIVLLISLIALSLVQDVMYFPVVCLAIALGLAVSFAMSNSLWPLLGTAGLVFLYGYEYFNYGIMVKTVNTADGLMALLLWIGSSIILVAISGITSEFNRLAGAAAWIYSVFIWIMPFHYAGSSKDPVGFKYLFRALYILLAVVFLVLIIYGLRRSKNEDDFHLNSTGFLADMVSLVVGVIPLFIASLIKSLNSVVAMILILIAYMGCGFLVNVITEAIRGKEKNLRTAIGPMMLPLVITGLVNFYPGVTEKYLIPYGFFPAVYNVLNNNITASFAAGIANVAEGINFVISGILYLILSLILRIFDKKINMFSMPAILAFMIVFACVVVITGIGVQMAKQWKTRN